MCPTTTTRRPSPSAQSCCVLKWKFPDMEIQYLHWASSSLYGLLCVHTASRILHYCQDQFASYQSNSWSAIHSLYSCPIVYLQYYSTEYGFRYLTKGIKCILVLFVLKSWSQVNSQLTMRQGPLPVYAMNSKQRLSCQCQCGPRSEDPF